MTLFADVPLNTIQTNKHSMPLIMLGHCSLCSVNRVVRTQLICGVNRVTRCLERDELQLVVVDRSSPWQLHQHLAQLSAVRECKAIAIDNLSASLSPLLAVSRLCAIGIKVLGVVCCRWLIV
jgi:ribosomal protein L7Ae-like RNA K-turn-binding protein